MSDCCSFIHLDITVEKRVKCEYELFRELRKVERRTDGKGRSEQWCCKVRNFNEMMHKNAYDIRATKSLQQQLECK